MIKNAVSNMEFSPLRIASRLPPFPIFLKFQKFPKKNIFYKNQSSHIITITQFGSKSHTVDLLCVSNPIHPLAPNQRNNLNFDRNLNLGVQKLEMQGTCTKCKRSFCWNHTGNHLREGEFIPPVQKRRSNVGSCRVWTKSC